MLRIYYFLVKRKKLSGQPNIYDPIVLINQTITNR